MSRLLWLPDVLRSAGVDVRTVDGWESRGRADIDPRCIVDHHTASQPPAPTPSLNICTYGRPGPPPLPGPLCNILTGRDLSVRVIASGVSNNAGPGGARQFSASNNRHTIGHEVEHAGTTAEPVAAALLECVATVDAAVCRHLGWTADRCVAHKEWAPKRKIDPIWSQDDHRTRVAALLDPSPPPVQPGAPSMDFTAAHDAVRQAYLDKYGHTGDAEGRIFWTETLMRDGYAGWANLVRTLAKG